MLLADKKKEDLARLYRLLSRVERGLVAVAAMVREYVQTAGLAIVREREAAIASGAKESANNPSFVKALLDLHDESKSLVTSEFSGNSLFQKALKDAFEVFVNKEVASKFSNAEMICTYTDSLLKTGGAKLSEAQVEEQLDRVDQLFSFISDKDLFAEIYRNQLAKRLLNQRSASDDAERSMISKLKLRCGAQYTGKMEGMLADLAVGADHHRDFKTFLGEQEDGGGAAGNRPIATSDPTAHAEIIAELRCGRVRGIARTSTGVFRRQRLSVGFSAWRGLLHVVASFLSKTCS